MSDLALYIFPFLETNVEVNWLTKILLQSCKYENVFCFRERKRLAEKTFNLSGKL